jgi:hypothetical protein
MVSVVITALNEERHIAAGIESALALHPARAPLSDCHTAAKPNGRSIAGRGTLAFSTSRPLSTAMDGDMTASSVPGTRDEVLARNPGLAGVSEGTFEPDVVNEEYE